MTTGGKENFLTHKETATVYRLPKSVFLDMLSTIFILWGQNELMTKDYSPYFQDRKTRAEGETACNQTSWGAVVLKIGCKFPILGLYGEPCCTSVDLWVVLSLASTKSRTHSSQKTLWFTFGWLCDHFQATCAQSPLALWPIYFLLSHLVVVLIKP